MVVSEPLIVKIAKRNMQGIVPLYYIARKAGVVPVNGEEIFKGLNAAYKGSKIGMYSNNISKIWNSRVWESDDEEAKAEALKCIKYLTMENNYVIDYAKTLYMPTRPPEVDAMIRKYVGSKVPFFFQYAKNKKPEQVAPLNNSTVNRLEQLIKNPRLNFKNQQIGKCLPKYLMRDRRIKLDEDFIAKYDEIAQRCGSRLSNTDEDKLHYYIKTVLETLDGFGYTRYECCDMLIKHLFIDKTTKRKKLFWLCYGDVVVKNLKTNIPPHSVPCTKCGRRFVPADRRQKLCPTCRAKKLIKPETKKLKCVDCGKSFTVGRSNKRTCRCEKCREIKKVEQARIRQQRRRAKS